MEISTLLPPEVWNFVLTKWDHFQNLISVSKKMLFLNTLIRQNKILSKQFKEQLTTQFHWTNSPPDTTNITGISANVSKNSITDSSDQGSHKQYSHVIATGPYCEVKEHLHQGTRITKEHNRLDCVHIWMNSLLFERRGSKFTGPKGNETPKAPYSKDPQQEA